MSDVFVSYKAEDRRRVRPLVESLEADGYSVWWDEQIGGGAAWRQAIEDELNEAKCVIVAWSKRSVGPEGTFVQDEATRAQQRRESQTRFRDLSMPTIGNSRAEFASFLKTEYERWERAVKVSGAKVD